MRRRDGRHTRCARDRNLALAGLWPVGTAACGSNVYDGETWDLGKPARTRTRRAPGTGGALDAPGAGRRPAGRPGVRHARAARLPRLLHAAHQPRALPAAGPPPVTRRLQQADVSANDASLRAAGSRSFGALRFSTDRGGVALRLEAIDIRRATTGRQVTRVDRNQSIEDASRLDLGAFAEASLPFAGVALVAATGARYDWVETKSTGASFGDQANCEDAVTGFAALTWHFGAGLGGGAHGRAPSASRACPTLLRRPTGRAGRDRKPRTAARDDQPVGPRGAPHRRELALRRIRLQLPIFDLIERYEGPGRKRQLILPQRRHEKLEGVELETEIDFGPRWVLALGPAGPAARSSRAAASRPTSPALRDGGPCSTARPTAGGCGCAPRPCGRTTGPGPTEIDTPRYGLVGVGAGYQVSPLFGSSLSSATSSTTYPATPDAGRPDGPGINAQLVVRGVW